MPANASRLARAEKDRQRGARGLSPPEAGAQQAGS
jgi:hypothetical protein